MKVSLPVKSAAGQDVGTYDLDLSEISPEISKQLLHDAVVMYETNRRQGTAKTKSRAEVAGSTKKIYRQKGTGRARAGNKRTHIRRGGGHAFARVPVDYSYRMPKYQVRLATRMALRSKFEDNQVVIVDTLSVSEPKTKVIATALKSLGLADASCLLAIQQGDVNLWRSARNIADLRVSPAAELNAYDLLRQRMLLVTKDALDRLREPRS